MLISTLYALKTTSASVQYGLYFMSGAVPDQANTYYDRAALMDAAVAGCRVTMSPNVTDFSLTASSYSTLKVGAGQTVWLANNTSTIVIPSKIQLPLAPVSDTLAVNYTNAKWLLANQTRTLTFTDRNMVSAGELNAGQYLTFGFRSPTNVTKIQYTNVMFSADVESSVNGTDWVAAGTMGLGVNDLTVNMSNILWIRFKAKVAVSIVNGNYLFFGTETAIPAAPAITHAVLVNYTGLNSEQKSVLLSTYSDTVNALAIQFTAGGPLSTGKELYASTDTVAPAAEIFPITFTLTGNILASV